MNQSVKSFNIGTILISFLFGVVSAVLSYQYMDMPLTYTDFIAGSITWGGEGKSKDVSLIFTFILTSSLSIILLDKLQTWVNNKSNENVAKEFSIILLYTTIPFVIWIGEQFLSKGIPHYELLFFNAWIILGGISATFLIMIFFHEPKIENNGSQFIVYSFILFTFVTLSPDVFGVILTRFGIVETLLHHLLSNAHYIVPFMWLVMLYFSKNKVQYYKYSLLIFQILIIGYFILLIPSPYKSEGNLSFFPIKSSLYIIVIILVTYGIFDIYKRFKLNKFTNELSFSMLSPLTLVALFILIFFSSSALPKVSPDDYHFGEKLLPFFMISKYHIVPYADYALAHGFIDMIPAVGSNLFLDGTASTLYEGNRILTAIILIIVFLVVYHYMGLFVATLLTLLAIPIGIWYFIAIVMSLIIINIKIEKIGVSFFVISWFLVLLAPGQGIVFILAILPLVIYRAWRAKLLILNIKFVGLSFVILIIAALLMPWVLDMTFSAIKYVLENGPLNFQAYGIPWHKSWNTSKTLNSSLAIYETIRTSWVFLPIIILSFWLLGYYKEKKEALFYALFGVVFVLVMHKYSVGRIDPFGLTRLGIVSSATIPLLFLSVHLLQFSKVTFSYWVIVAVFWMGLLTPNYLKNPIDNAKRGIFDIGTLTKGSEVDIPKLGQGKTDSTHINRTIEIKRIVDQFLDINETFVDITNRGALYFYLNRKMPIEAVAYNQPHSYMQQRSVDRLVKDPPPMALLKSDNINHDGRSVSIRTYYLYRWVIENYIPVSINNIIIGVHKSKVNRFNNRFPNTILPVSSEDKMSLWDKVFLLYDLQQLPLSWGRSQEPLTKQMTEKDEVKFNVKSLHNVQAIDGEKYQIIGKDPFIVYDISKYNLSGKDAGLLSFNFTCDNKNVKPRLQLFYSADDYAITPKTVVTFTVSNGPIIVPLDVMPRWISAKHIKKIRMNLYKQTDCKVFSIENLKINQRILNIE